LEANGQRPCEREVGSGNRDCTSAQGNGPLRLRTPLGESVFHSAFDIYRIGPGPSSSRTAAPHRAAQQFLHALAAEGRFGQCARVEVRLLGALALIGRELAVHKAVVAGLAGEPAERCDAQSMDALCARVESDKRITLAGQRTIAFDIAHDVRFNVAQTLAEEASALRFDGYDQSGGRLASRLYLCGGYGEVLDTAAPPVAHGGLPLPFVYTNAAELLELCGLHRKKIADIARSNECVRRSPGELRSGLMRVALAMRASIERGLGTTGGLPGGRLQRRAAAQKSAIDASPSPAETCALYATAVAEESAAGGRVVSAPTNGSAGPVAALLEHMRLNHSSASEDRTVDFLLVAACVGSLLRAAGLRQAGCQSAVGVSAAMAAAGCVAAWSGSNAQALWAAEQALERHLNLACDSSDGRVQQPCIERNATGAAIAYTATQEALRQRDPRVRIDHLAATMVDAARIMSKRAKTASLGGIAVNIADC